MGTGSELNIDALSLDKSEKLQNLRYKNNIEWRVDISSAYSNTGETPHPRPCVDSQQSPQHHPPVIVGVRDDLHFVPCEVAVGEEIESTASLDAHGVHVVPILPEGGEPSDPEL